MLNKFLSQAGIDLTTLNQLSQGSMTAHLDIRFTALGPDFIMAEMPVDHRTRQPFGLLHGGASIVLAETVGSIGSGALTGFDMDTRIVGVEVSGSHLRGVQEGKVTGIARPLKVGRSMHFWKIEVVDALGRLACFARLTVQVSKGRSGS